MSLVKLENGQGSRRYLEEVLSAGNRAKDLVRQILVFSRQSDNSRGPVAMHKIAHEVLALLQASLPANVDIRRNVDHNCLPVAGDPVQMHQILMNLCTNAQHAMKAQGGTLEVAVAPAEFDTPIELLSGPLEAGNYVHLRIGDTGAGMDNETLERIFEPFFTTKGVGEGTGMGLAIVHGIVTSLNGGIDVRSAPGRGTTFDIWLPCYEGEVRGDEGITDGALHGNESILVVDDETQLVKLWREMLEEFGYIVTACDDSLDARRIFEAEPDRFDLVLLDQTMPQLNGLDLARLILRRRPDLPVVLATGFSEHVTAEDARAAGICDFVLKPIIARDLGRVVRRALDEPRSSAA